MMAVLCWTIIRRIPAFSSLKMDAMKASLFGVQLAGQQQGFEFVPAVDDGKAVFHRVT